MMNVIYINSRYFKYVCGICHISNSCSYVLYDTDTDRAVASSIMDRLPYRQKFLNDRNSKICYHSLKDHPKVSKTAKFRCEML